MFSTENCGKLVEKSGKYILVSFKGRRDTVRKQTAHQLSVLAAVAAATLTVAELVRRWVYSNTKREEDPLGPDDPAGLHLRNEIIWRMARTTILPVGYLNWVLGNLKLTGIEYVREALASGKGNQVVGNHTSTFDTFMPQIILWFHGFRELAEDMFRYPIGTKFVNRRPVISKIIEGCAHFHIVPPSMLEMEFLRKIRLDERKQHLRNARRVNTLAFQGMGESLRQWFWTLLFPEATRVKKRGMGRVHEGIAAALRHPGTNIQPMAIVGTDLLWPPGSWIPKLVGRFEIIFGKPIPYEVFDYQARELSAEYVVTPNRALADLVMRAIAVLFIENGHDSYAGYYALPLEKIYTKRNA